MKQIKAKGLAL